MITEKQKRLSMRFADGRLIEADPPEWFMRHLAGSDDHSDWRGSIIDCGCSGLESFGEDETFTIFRSPNGYFVEYTDVHESAAWIFIDRPVDYVTFRATYLAPLALLQMKADRFEEDRMQRKGPR